MSSSLMLSSLVGLVLIVGTLATSSFIADKKSHEGIQRSCDLEKGTVCIPTACSNNVCSLFKDAVCVPDRCGCEARFFNWIAKESIYSDVSKMCSSANFVLNFLNFTTIHANDSAAFANEEGQYVVRKFFKEFNLLVTEILKDIADYLKTVSEATPTQENINKLKDIIRTLNLRSKAKELADGEVQERINWKGVISGLAHAGVSALSDEDAEIKAVQERSFWTKAIGAAFKIGKELLSDEDAAAAAADLEVKSFLSTLGKVAKGAFKIAQAVLLDEDATTPSKVGKQFAVDFKTLQDVLSTKPKGLYYDEIKSGKVAISDKDAQKKLMLVIA
ncbi:hypothetical protein BV898_10878 [Hypsibius exemplaris]|uniref:Uncharacterized protein n=1 Tax=Hypsibius exemplaris TaxID=2072580 RepID=A0A1W0WIH2_HYPEX|nr:hypothetical protein BV898_10878 [Hypsibius exemplaris]